MPGENGGSIRPMTPDTNQVSAEAVSSRLARATAALNSAIEQRTQAPRQIRTVRFIKRKETPGTIVFQEQPLEGEPEVIGNLYVKKWFAGSAQSITVTVEKG